MTTRGNDQSEGGPVTRKGEIRRAVVAIQPQRRPWGYSYKLECGHWLDMTVYSSFRRDPKKMRCRQCEEERRLTP